MAGLVQTVAPTIEPLSDAEARTHLRLGTGNTEPAPTAPSVALAGAGAGSVTNGVHRYRVTFVTADGETEGGTISSAVTVADNSVNGKVSVTGIPLGGSLVTSRKLYRTAAGGSTYLLLATLADNTTTSYTDNIADASLGAEAPSTNTTADPELRALIVAARQYCETFTGRAFITRTLRLTLDAFPWCENHINLPRPNLLTVTSVQYVDTNGDTQTFSSSDYSVDTASLPGAIRLGYGKSWPSTRCQPNAVTITFTAGYGPARSDVPETIRAAMKLYIGDLYENRESSIIGTIQTDNPTVAALLWSERFLEVA